MDRTLKRFLGLDLWHLVALVVVLMYTRFVFHRITARVPLFNRIGNDSTSYYVADSLAALLFIHILMSYGLGGGMGRAAGRGVGAVAGVGLLWLVMNYIGKLDYAHEQWYAYDGFALAVFLAAYLR